MSEASQVYAQTTPCPWLAPHRAAEYLYSLSNSTGATQVRPFSHLVRRERWEEAQAAWEGKEDDEVIRKKVPARFAHVDHSYTGAVQILNDNITDEAERARLTTNTRWGIINVWRP
jgi:hypothetical protein